MALNTNFNVNPYYDDYDEDKLHLRMLFKPGYAVQARELTQIQTLLQKQVSRMGDSFFQNGTKISGGAIVEQLATYINLSSSYIDTTVNVEEFEGKTIVDDQDEPTKRAQVLKVYDTNTGVSPNEPKTLIVKQIFGDPFTGSETISTLEINPVFANTTGTGKCQTFSVDEGVFYYEGFFVKSLQQTIAVSKYGYSNTNVKVGFEVTESIVNSFDDTSLLDPAQTSSNYQAPGSDRFKITFTLVGKDIDSEDTTKFVELGQFIDSTPNEANSKLRFIEESSKTVLSGVIEDTLARRTYDESGNYTVKPFELSLETNAANTAQTNVILSPGKAYVFGYEFETSEPTIIVSPKPRTTESVSNKRITADYGNFVYANNIHGSPPIGGSDLVDLHCVPNSVVGFTATTNVRTDTQRVGNTRIGTARVKSIAYETTTNAANANTFIYRTYLFDVRVNNVVRGWANTVVNASAIKLSATGLGHFVCNSNNAYAGARFKITSGPGSTELPKVIRSFDATNQIITLDQPFITLPVAANTTAAANSATSRWAINFEFNDAKSMIANVSASSTARPIFAADIDSRSRDSGSIYNEIAMSETSTETMIFPLGESYIANNSIADFVYSYKKLYSGSGSGETFDSSGKTTLALSTGESLSSAASESSRLSNYTVIVTDSTGTGYYNGQILNPSQFSIAGQDLTVTTAGATFKANIIATIDVTTSSQKNKTLVLAAQNVSDGSATTMHDVFANGAIRIFPTIGQVHVSANTVVKIPGRHQWLYIPDGARLRGVFDFGENAVTSANLSTATNVTGRYYLNTGQRNSYYDFASIVLRAGNTPPSGNILIRFDHYVSTGSGYFTTTSYPNYDIIPTYRTNQKVYKLRDCIDFRPVRVAATTPARANAIVFDSVQKTPVVGSNIDLDYQYYLPRIDKVVLNKNKSFELLQGEPLLNPAEPKDKSGAMTLFILSQTPYVSSVKEIQVKSIDHKRYTMRDIGAIDKRVENLEQLTSLNILEQATLNQQDLTTRDSIGVQRFKNGVIADTFTGHSIGDVASEDYAVSIDVIRNELRPTFNISNHVITFDLANSTNYTANAEFATMRAFERVFISQTKASSSANVNPFNVVDYIGTISLEPNSDTWYDNREASQVLINSNGSRDAWDLSLEGSKTSTELEWNSWQNIWSGINLSGQQASQDAASTNRGDATYSLAAQNPTASQNRSGIQTLNGNQSIIQSVGNRVVDVSVIPYIRSKRIIFRAKKFRRFARLYPYFDGVSVVKNVARANRVLTKTDPRAFYVYRIDPDGRRGERVRIVRRSNNQILITSRAIEEQVGGPLTRNAQANTIFIVDGQPNAVVSQPGCNLVGLTSGTTREIIGYLHYSGNVNAATTSTVTLRIDASNANNEKLYANTNNSNAIFIVSGTGRGQLRTMNAYNAQTRTANISEDWVTVPDSNSIYSIGYPETTIKGIESGSFYLPNRSFRVGEKTFRLSDSSTNDVASGNTSGDVSYFAQGLLKTNDGTVVSVTPATTTRISSTDLSVVSASTAASTAGYYNPIAQTFLVSSSEYPEGVFVKKIRLCFSEKDSDVPITLQLRPVVNGFPSASIIYPSGSVTVDADDVNVTTIPRFTSGNPTVTHFDDFTVFEFENPVYLQPGEHSFVLYSNSNKYKVYVAEVGKDDIRSRTKISAQPYTGSFYLSQNGSAWTTEQGIDMMFQIIQYQFTPGSATVYLQVDAPDANVPFDLAYLIPGDLVLPNTSVNYSFKSQRTNGNFVDFKTIIPLENYNTNDGFGRRVLDSGKGNSTFVLKATMSSLSRFVSPVLDGTRFGLIAVENVINDMPLSNNDVIIDGVGSGMTDGIYTLSLSGGGGVGATVRANVVSGSISRAWVENGGFRYTTSPTINLFNSSASSANGYVGKMCVGVSANNAQIVINGEDKKSGGNGLARYITRRVTLADNFEAGDLRVYLTAYRPAGTNIYVYYKILSPADTDNFNDKEYQLMTEIGTNNFISASEQDTRELVFAPGILNVANNSVSYTEDDVLYDKFKTFSIKIVLAGSTSVDGPSGVITQIPTIRDFRAIALPRG